METAAPEIEPGSSRCEAICVTPSRQDKFLPTPLQPHEPQLHNAKPKAISSPPTKANRVQYPAGSPDFRKWESCRTMPLVGGFSRGSPVSPASSFRRLSISTSITLVGYEDLNVKSCTNLFTSSVNFFYETIKRVPIIPINDIPNPNYVDSPLEVEGEREEMENTGPTEVTAPRRRSLGRGDLVVRLLASNQSEPTGFDSGGFSRVANATNAAVDPFMYMKTKKITRKVSSLRSVPELQSAVETPIPHLSQRQKGRLQRRPVAIKHDNDEQLVCLGRRQHHQQPLIVDAETNTHDIHFHCWHVDFGRNTGPMLENTPQCSCANNFKRLLWPGGSSPSPVSCLQPAADELLVSKEASPASDHIVWTVEEVGSSSKLTGGTCQ
ncbi:hypothetical protein PR048_025102 [Dryococelus australis]|uniref:Uncharacterized protein n=1 Tax=Dryococelus australis TaxID=614101 RepID=A0ABQ9GQI7_9NEOP|nr:hypothetical protein PR048_025102 [Dryococelus australis]